MKRIIKFRIWNGREMDYNIMAGFLGVFYVQGLDEKDYASLSPFNTKYPVETPLMQFTGLHDKNGKEIFEGDIVKCDELIMTVEFVQSSFCKCNENGNWIIHSHDNIEVIGNLYENYELINPK
jgi:uncharacterized phage protein (TIGR01671 family)